jgi:hypothetical protein
MECKREWGVVVEAGEHLAFTTLVNQGVDAAVVSQFVFTKLSAIEVSQIVTDSCEDCAEYRMTKRLRRVYDELGQAIDALNHAERAADSAGKAYNAQMALYERLQEDLPPVKF